MRARVVAALMLGALTAAVGARADEPPTLRANHFSPYEQMAIDAALADLHETRELEPEGKIVEGIDIVTLDVIEPRDPVPTFVNIFHATTRRYIVDQEILVRPGDRYQGAEVDHSVRNLRAKVQLSLVIVIATRGSEPGRVRILVITKDVWSLRLNSDFQVSSGGLEDLIIQPSETNFLGTHTAASLLFELDPATATFGLGYTAPRLSGTRVTLGAIANAIVNRATGALEGSTGSLLAYQPLFAPTTPWSWDSSMTWDKEIARRFINARQAYFVGGPIREDYVPWLYDQRIYNTQETVTRSFGRDAKNDFSLGAYASLSEYRIGDVAGVSPYAVTQFVNEELPRSDNRVGPFVQWHSYQTRFVRLLDYQTLGLQEDYRLGYELYARVYPVVRALGSSRDFVGVYGGAQYTIPLGDGLVRGNVESTTEAETSEISDAWVAGELQLVSPRFGFGRIVYDAYVLSRYRNYLNVQSFLGGNLQLRGYPTNFFVGKDVLTSNLEYRTRPVEILHAMELGAAAFYDVGDAFTGFSRLRPNQSVGLGLRTLFPQLDRAVFRVDFGFPVGEGAHLAGVAPMSFFIAFAQAFDAPALATVALPSGPN